MPGRGRHGLRPWAGSRHPGSHRHRITIAVATISGIARHREQQRRRKQN